MPVIPASDRPFIRSLMSYFRIRRLRAEEVDTPGSDIGVRLPRRGTPTLLIGRKWRRNRALNRQLAHKQLVHEALHVRGYDHDDRLRSLGYASRDRRKDVLSAHVYDDIQSGSRRFDHRRFGLPAPQRRA